jgi:hypothetical protein
MFVFTPAAYGGDGTFASVSAIYNELAKLSPDLLDVLALPDWPFDRYFYLPLFFMSCAAEVYGATFSLYILHIFSKGLLIKVALSISGRSCS